MCFTRCHWVDCCSPSPLTAFVFHTLSNDRRQSGVFTFGCASINLRCYPIDNFGALCNLHPNKAWSTASYSEGSETEQLHQNTANLFLCPQALWLFATFLTIPRGDMTDSKSLNVLLAWAEINIWAQDHLTRSGMWVNHRVQPLGILTDNERLLNETSSVLAEAVTFKCPLS